MIVRIPVGDLTLGMFVRDPQCRWSGNGDGLVLRRPDELARIRESAVEYVLVDTGRAVAVKPATKQKSQDRPQRTAVLGTAAGKRAAKAIDASRKAVAKIADDIRLGRPIQLVRLAPLIEELSEQVRTNTEALFSLLRIKRRDQYTYLHSVAVAALMINLARAVGEDEASVAAYGTAGLLHDAGKIAVPEQILNKPDRLTDAEFDVMRSHPALGHRILAVSSGISALALDVCLHHHERPDGRGYPDGLDGADLSRAARMAAICDVYDALTSDRAYKDAWSPQRALEAMQSWTGQFDAELLSAFVSSLGIFPVGSLVRVRDSALAIVIADNHAEPTCPTVRSFYSITRGCRVRCEDVQIRAAGVLSPERPERWGFDDWPSLAATLLEQAADHTPQRCEA